MERQLADTDQDVKELCIMVIVWLSSIALVWRYAKRHAGQEESFRRHLLLVLAGHRKLPTRLVHVVTATGMVSALLCAVHATTKMRFVWLLVGIQSLFLYRAFQGAPQPLFLGLWTTAAIGVSAVIIFSPQLSLGTDYSSVGRCLLLFVAIGLPEHCSHHLFDDGDRNLITKGKTGLSKV